MACRWREPGRNAVYLGVPAFTRPTRARSIRVCPGAIAVRPMIMVIPQLICCGITMKTEITRDHAVPWARVR